MTILKEILSPVNGITCLKFMFINIFILGDKKSWLLIDTGLKGMGCYILEAANRLGLEKTPKAILITHSHFEHIGSLSELIKKWNVPVFANEKEIPFIIEQSNSCEDIKKHIKPLPEDGSIPYLPDWKWVPTPGHTLGHISLYLHRKGILIAGDALLSTEQKPDNNSGVNKYLRPNWEIARESIYGLAKLNPTMIAHSHGRPITNERIDLKKILKKFDLNISNALKIKKQRGRPKKLATSNS